LSNKGYYTPRKRTDTIRHYNFKKANWDNFKTQLDTEINKITSIPENYGPFSNLVKNISKQNIPRGCRTQYIPGMGKENKELLENYINQFNNDPFAEETIITGESLVEKLSEARREKWRSLISQTNMTQNSSKAWRMLRNLGNDPKNAESHINVTPNEIALQLLKTHLLLIFFIQGDSFNVKHSIFLKIIYILQNFRSMLF